MTARSSWLLTCKYLNSSDGFAIVIDRWLIDLSGTTYSGLAWAQTRKVSYYNVHLTISRD